MKETLPKGARRVAPTYPDIKKIIKPEQLAAIGALALAFNELEGTIERLFFTATELSDQLQFEISAKMGGSTYRMVIVKIAAQALLTGQEMDLLTNCLNDGERGFETLQDCRNGVVHVRNLNSVTNVGTTPKNNGDVVGRLVRMDLLESAYNLIVAINNQLQATHFLLDAIKKLNACKGDDPEKAQREEAVKACRQSFLDSHNARQALPKLPKFPSESELQAAKIKHDQEFLLSISQAVHQQWDIPPHFQQTYLSPAVRNTLGIQSTPLPLSEAQKKK